MANAQHTPVGVFKNKSFEVVLDIDGTFVYKSIYGYTPAGYDINQVYEEKGNCILENDTIFLNPDKSLKHLVKTEILENQQGYKGSIYFQFNVVRNYYNENDVI